MSAESEANLRSRRWGRRLHEHSSMQFAYLVFKDRIFRHPLAVDGIWADIVSENCQLSFRFSIPLS